MQQLLAKFLLMLWGAWDLASATITRVAWTFAPGGRAMLIVGPVLALLLAALCYYRTTEGLTIRSRILLAGTRFVALCVVLLMLSGAVCSIGVARRQLPSLLVIVDDSPSMALPLGGQPRDKVVQKTLDSGLLAYFQQAHDVRVLHTSGRADAAVTDTIAQDLGRALIQRASESPERAPSHVLLVSDGVELGGSALDRAAREVPAAVSALSVGDPAAIKDVLIGKVWVPSFAYENDRALVTAEVRAIGLSGEATLRLLQIKGGVEKEISTSTITLKPGGEPTLARIEFQTPAAGLERYTIKLASAPGELTELNNAATFNLDVRPEKVRVLFVEGEPSWEYRFVKQNFESDPVVEFHGLVRLPEQEWFYQGSQNRADGKPVFKDPTKGFPATQDELDYFDVLILGDLERKQLDQLDRFGMVDAFVKTHGGGLVTIGGMRVYGAGNYEGTPLSRMLPVEMTPGNGGAREKKQQLINRFNVEVTTQGLMHPLMQLEYDPVKNAQAWKGLPWVEGGNALAGIKPGATALMVHPTLRNKLGPRAIAAAWQYGRGRVMSSALDGTWHWRLARTTETDYHKRWWGLAARWLAGDPRSNKPFGNLVVEDPVIEVGKPATFYATFRDADGNPRIDASADFTVEPPSGADKKIWARAASDPRVPGRYGFTFEPKEPGEHTVSLAMTTQGGESHEEKRVYYVAPSREEYLQPVPDRAALESLAKATGGSVADLADYRSLKLPDSPPTVRAESVVISVWQSPGLFVLLLVCLFVEWLMRKRRGLA